MSSTAFLAGLPLHFHPFRSDSSYASEKRKNTSPLRPPLNAVADAPDDSKGDADDGQLAKSRASFEQMFKLELPSNEDSKGHCKCIWCDGTKQRRCSWCDGKGFRHETVNKTWDQLLMEIERMQKSDDPVPMEEPERVPVQCSACSGSKKLRCAYCRGSGIGSYGHAY